MATLSHFFAYLENGHTLLAGMLRFTKQLGRI